MYSVVLSRVSKTYHLDTVEVPALVGIDLEIRANCFTVISWPSGSGKTAILSLIGCIDRPDSGEVVLAEKSINLMSIKELSDFRLHHLGFIFRNFNLLPVLAAYENVEYPLILLKVPAAERRQRVMTLLDAVGLAGKAGNRPSQLSGGQRQRVAIARALAGSPKLVLADEPTANLDTETGASVIALMRKMQRDHKVAFVFSSHDPKVLAEADDAVFIRDGRIVNIERRVETQIPAATARLNELLATQFKGMPLEVLDYETLTPIYQQVIQFFNSMFGFIAILIYMIVLFTVGNTMSMAVVERTAEVGTLRAIGQQRGGIRAQFICEGVLLGLIGGALGIAIALPIAYLINHSGMTWAPPGYSYKYPVMVRVWGDYQLMFGTAFNLAVVAAVSAWLPANRAAKLDIVDALRHAC
ncbi:ATP-binding cassette domain-containing protein (plasmid) [Ralstonia pseudosolanacearum]|uniref:ATP-binding cassette domain-containing protein n=2 Tax=Ralstonia solanacearum species complex TaxID=3116862 RepID=A0AA92IFZ3_RALSL|nr:ATP-binding cassette domain-containing protein [Ralstonia pseudosolanacearum]